MKNDLVGVSMLGLARLMQVVSCMGRRDEELYRNRGGYCIITTFQSTW